VNFAICYAISKRLLGESNWMWVWWGFAFLPLPPHSFDDAVSLFWTTANLFTDPGGLDTPLTPIGTGLIGLGLFSLGAARLVLARRWGPIALFLGPILLAMLASAAKRYPFHGRIILYLAPGLIMVLAEGIATFARPRWRPLAVAILGFFLIVPLGRFAMSFDQPRTRSFDSHGDQRNDLLDYLDRLRSRPVVP
jgi:hypothetical protein